MRVKVGRMRIISYYIDVGRLIQPNAASKATKGSGDRLMIRGSIHPETHGSIQMPTGSDHDKLRTPQGQQQATMVSGSAS